MAIGGASESGRAAASGIGRLGSEPAARRVRLPSRDQEPLQSPAPLPADVAFLARAGIQPGVLLLAARLARLRRTSARRELFALRSFDPALYWRLLARDLGIAFVSDAAEVGPYPGARPVEARIAARAERVLVIKDGASLLLVAPTDAAKVADLAARLRAVPELRARIAIAAPETIRKILLSRSAEALSYAATHRLARAAPTASAMQTGSRPARIAVGGSAAFFVAAAAFSPFPSGALVGLCLCAFFFLAILFKGVAALARPARLEPPPLRDADLPPYTVLVPLHREAAVMPDLVRHLAAIDYPASKLQCLLLIERGDEETLEAAARHAHDPRFQVVVVPTGAPRTKPRALVYGLSFAAGRYCVVFDAEDRPEPDQLRKAAALFAVDPELGCVQARLTTDNTENLVSALFAIEYAANFDVLLPALAAWRMPIPLGGTSNHFPMRVLKRIGAWDPFNVTEDADLGLRLARFGYHTKTIASRTFEEAPVGRRQWMAQRRRWLKGWMQTLLVAFRPAGPGVPRLTFSDALAVMAILGTGVAGFLVYPLVLAMLAIVFLLFGEIPPPETPLVGALMGFSLLNGILLVVFSAVMAVRGLLAIRRPDLMPLVPLLPLYWLAMSLAAWQALFQLLRTPFLWEKTEHGLSRARRTGSHPARSAAAAPPR
ncbi:glycosyltransferase [Afifella sp. IM 167]|uniref:glycosyltransferase n=1 Tax=Afifella sp. IM 167 TaxID=2033586 RepID=UPI001CCBEA78|nr:glycosyltransferase [Afifella sp. IM 167]